MAQSRYLEHEQAWSKAETKLQTEKKLAESFGLADLYLNRTYLDFFSSAPILTADRLCCDSSKIRITKITKIVLDEEEKSTERLKSVYGALHNIQAAVCLIVDSFETHIDFYIAVRSDSNPSLAGDILMGSLRGNFPGINLNLFSQDQTRTLLSSFKERDIKSLASVSIIPSTREKDEVDNSFTQGLEKFIDSLKGYRFTCYLLATPLDDQAMERKRHGYEQLYSSLSPHGKLTISYGKNESEAVNSSISNSFSKSVNKSVSNSNTRSTSSSHGTNSGYNSSSSSNSGFSGDGFSFGWGSSDGYSSGSFDSYTSGNSFTNSVSDSVGNSSSESRSQGETKTAGTSNNITLTYENKGVQMLMERAQDELERFRLCESFGMWEYSAYFFSKDIHTTALSSNTYKALMTGNASNVESSHLNLWSVNQLPSIRNILENILYLRHPRARLKISTNSKEEEEVIPTNLVNGNELPLVMGFPKKSVSGLAVVEMAEFGRNVVYEFKQPTITIDFGNIYHMGVVEDNRVDLDLNLLSSHCFITGSSGSGKSYATYQLLNSVLEKGIKTLIIEPAKGEYKEVFGGLKGIKIFTTNPNAYRLLKINPFEFPDEIHILAHIEQLLQIFNASWPLYAAMPAILKQAVVQAYETNGWDVQNSIWIPEIGQTKYPTFKDVLEVLPKIINESDYSADSKGDYKGALLTRVESMTVGINGLIFKSARGIDNSLLFDSNAVIDLSDLGSDEAVALIMGILIMKLNEYRKCQRKKAPGSTMDSDLKHITVLEEAHNLLKRTSKDQNQEGANMIGKSVEMISNSIKEMRTYGEGFLIIDQSPMAVDSSAIENTSTKIIMNLPARDACQEVASALSLTEKQASELSKLNVGVAAVFQKGWLNPVLMKVDLWDNRYKSAPIFTNPSQLKLLRGLLIEELLSQCKDGRFIQKKLRQIIKNSDLPIDKKREFDEILNNCSDIIFSNNSLTRSSIGNLILSITGTESLFSIMPMTDIPSFEEFSQLPRDSEDFKNLVRNYRSGAIAWFEKICIALSNYVILSNEEDKAKAVLYMLNVLGNEGKITTYRHNKLAMIHRMLFRILDIEMKGVFI